MSKIGFLNVNPVSGNTIPTTITIVPDAYTSEKQQTLVFRNTKGKIARCLVTCTPKVKRTYINITPTILIFDSASITPQNLIVDSSDSWTAK